MSSVGKSGAWKALVPGSGGSGTAVGVGGAWKSVRAMWVGKDGAWKRFFVASTISVSATNVNESDSGTAASGSVSGSSTATPSGAQGTVSYFWEHVSTSSGNTPSIDANLTQSPNFTATVADGVNSVSTWKVTVTDDVGSASDTITVTLDWIQQGLVTVSGESIIESGGIGANTASVTFLASGTVGSSNGALDTATDWIRPTSGAGDGYQIRFTNLTGNPPLVTDGTLQDEWFNLSSGNFTLSLTSSFGTLACTFTIEIRLGTGPVLDSGIYSLQSTFESGGGGPGGP